MRDAEFRRDEGLQRDAELRGNEVRRGGIVPLNELDDFKVAEGDPDVRGWDVIAADGTKVGEVDELLVDTAAMKVRYLDVELDKDLIDAKDRHVLVPIGAARLNDVNDEVLVDSMQARQFASLPPYTGGSVTRDYETAVLQGIGETVVRPPSLGSDFYDRQHFDENRFYGSRRRGLGEADRARSSTPEREVGKAVVEEVVVRRRVVPEEELRAEELRRGGHTDVRPDRGEDPRDRP